MRLIVGFAFDHPVPSLHRTLAVRIVALSHVRCLVSGDLRQVMTTGLDCLRYSREAVADQDLVGADRSRAFSLLPEVQTVAVVAHRRGYAVRTKQHL